MTLLPPEMESQYNTAQLILEDLIHSGDVDVESAMFYSRTTTPNEAIAHLAKFGIQERIQVPPDTLHWPTVDEVPPARYFRSNRDGVRSAILGRIVDSMTPENPHGQVLEFPTAQPGAHAVLFTDDEKLRQDFLLSIAKSISLGAGRKGDQFPVRIWVANSGRRIANKLELLAPFADGPDDLLTPISASRGFVSLRLPQEFYSGDLSRTYGGQHVVLIEDISRIAPQQLDVIVRAVAADANVHLIVASEPNVRAVRNIIAPLRRLGGMYELFGRMDAQAARVFGGEEIVPFVTSTVLPPHQIIMSVRMRSGTQLLRAWIPNPGI